MLLPQFGQRRLDASEDRSLSELREYSLCIGEMPNGERSPSFRFMQQTQDHLRAANELSR